MKKIKTNTICSCIILIAVVVTTVWGFMFNGWDYSWIAMLAGVFLSGIVKMIRSDIEEYDAEHEN